MYLSFLHQFILSNETSVPSLFFAKESKLYLTG